MIFRIELADSAAADAAPTVQAACAGTVKQRRYDDADYRYGYEPDGSPAQDWSWQVTPSLSDDP